MKYQIEYYFNDAEAQTVTEWLRSFAFARNPLFRTVPDYRSKRILPEFESLIHCVSVAEPIRVVAYRSR